MKKNILIISAAAVGLLGTAVLAGVSTVSADDISPPANIIERLAEKFNLDTNEVEEVFDQNRREREEHRLGQLVSDGEITEEQAALMQEKSAEFHEHREEIRDTYDDPEERHEAMTELHDEMQEWADENELPVPMMWPRIGGGRGGHGMFGSQGMGSGYMGDCPYAEE